MLFGDQPGVTVDGMDAPASVDGKVRNETSPLELDILIDNDNYQSLEKPTASGSNIVQLSDVLSLAFPRNCLYLLVCEAIERLRTKETAADQRVSLST